MRWFRTSLNAGSVLFLLLLGAVPARAAAPRCGVFTESSGRVTVTSTGEQFSLSQLLNEGRFSGRPPGFGCWIEIGTSDAIRGALMYVYRVTDPSGESKEFGPYGIQEGGFGSTGAIPVPDYKRPVGTWTVEFLSVRRDNGLKASLGSVSFTMAGGPSTTQPPSASDGPVGVWDVSTGGLLGPDENTVHYRAILTIRKNGAGYSGSIRFTDLAITEELANVTYDPKAGELTFIRRPVLSRTYDQNFKAKITNGSLTGTLSWPPSAEGPAGVGKWWGTLKGRG